MVRSTHKITRAAELFHKTADHKNVWDYILEKFKPDDLYFVFHFTQDYIDFDGSTKHVTQWLKIGHINKPGNQL
ncbi:hypothetical protein PG984_003671 [Apiospora sp. TS-2023a]